MNNHELLRHLFILPCYRKQPYPSLIELTKYLTFFMKNMKTLPFLLVIFMLLSSTNKYAQTNPPTNLSATLGNPKSHITVELSWQYEHTTSPVQFDIYKKLGSMADEGEFIRIYSGYNNSDKYTDSDVQRDKTYSYYVVSSANNIESEPSNKLEVEVYAPVIWDDKIGVHLDNDSTRSSIYGGSVEFIPYDSSGTGFSAVTDDKGFIHCNVKPGTYYIYVSAPGYISEYYDNAPTKQLATVVTFIDNDSLIQPTMKKKGGVLISMGLKQISH